MTEDLLNQALDRALKDQEFTVVEKMSDNFKATSDVLDRVFGEVKKDLDRIEVGQTPILESDIGKLEDVLQKIAENTSVSVKTLNDISKYKGVTGSQASKIASINAAAAKTLAKKLGQSQRRTQQQQNNRNQGNNQQAP